MKYYDMDNLRCIISFFPWIVFQFDETVAVVYISYNTKENAWWNTVLLQCHLKLKLLQTLTL